jgi:DNA-binding PucR family transcriptional regulator
MMINPDNITDKNTSIDLNSDSISSAVIRSEIGNKYRTYSPILVGNKELQEALLFLRAYFGDEAKIIELDESLLVLIEYKKIEDVAEALNTAFLENFFNSSSVLYFRNGRNLTLEEKVSALLNNYDLLRRTDNVLRIAASEDLTLIALVDGLSDEMKNSYISRIAPYYKQLSPELKLTLSIFFDQNLSMSKTAKKLYIHRNTLTYRIGKIQQITGLDIRKINEALILVLSSYLIQDSE